jgi:energy-coupling factor transporter ATP-binding protein EcfA2
VEVGNKKDCGSTSKTIQVPSPVSPKSLLREQDILLENDLNVNLGETNINQALPVNPSEIRHLNDETVLSPVSPRSLLIAQEKQLANDMNEVSNDDTGSQTSFVNESQNVVVVRQAVASGKSPMESSSQPLFVAVTNTAVQIPDRVEKDMVFLKESWANMADAEEQLQKNLEDTGQHNLDDGFQVQLSKGQKRIQKKLKQSSRDSYATRSKGVSPKPFR